MHFQSSSCHHHCSPEEPASPEILTFVWVYWFLDLFMPFGPVIIIQLLNIYLNYSKLSVAQYLELWPLHQVVLGSIPRQKHVPEMQVQSLTLVRVHAGSSQSVSLTLMSLSHSLSPSLPTFSPYPPLHSSLPLLFLKTNRKNISGED